MKVVGEIRRELGVRLDVYASNEENSRLLQIPCAGASPMPIPTVMPIPPQSWQPVRPPRLAPSPPRSAHLAGELRGRRLPPLLPPDPGPTSSRSWPLPRPRASGSCAAPCPFALAAAALAELAHGSRDGARRARAGCDDGIRCEDDAVRPATATKAPPTHHPARLNHSPPSSFARGASGRRAPPESRGPAVTYPCGRRNLGPSRACVRAPGSSARRPAACVRASAEPAGLDLSLPG